MSQDILGEIRKSEEAFLDLSRLSGPELGPIIQRALFHLEELRQNLSKSSVSDPDLGKLFLKGFLGQVEEALLVSGAIVSMSTVVNEECGPQDWGNISRFLSVFVESLIKVPFKGHVNIAIEPDHLIIKGPLQDDLDVKEFRNFSYSLTKALLKSGVILTYSLNSEDVEYLTLDFHFPNEERGFVQIPLNNGIKASIDGRLGDYILDLNSKMPVGHVVIKVDQNGKASRVQEVSSEIKNQNRTLVYIPFLFRHVIFSFPKLEIKVANKIELNETENYHYLDLFSLISE